VVLLLVALSVVAGCDGGDDDQGSPRTSSAATTVPAPSPAEGLAARARAGVTREYTGRYALDSTDAKSPDATVTIYRNATSYRVDITRGSATSVLMTATQGLVSCQLTASRRTCLLVGAPGTEPPGLFDPGIQRLVTTDLVALAGDKSLTVTPAGTLPSTGSLPAATCYQVTGSAMDPGEYCLATDGTLRKAQFPSGTLELTQLAAAPGDSAFLPPVSPTPVPS
jgi:hypothetical protein